MVHSVVIEHEFIPHTKEQEVLAKIADNVGGSPPVVDISSALLKRCAQECETSENDEDFLEEFDSRVFKNASPDIVGDETNVYHSIHC